MRSLPYRYTDVLIGILAGIVGLSTALPARSQYTADFQTNLISGVTSNWTSSYIVGSNTFADTLTIKDGGVLSNSTFSYCYLGYESSSSNNNALVVGGSSIWANISPLVIGYNGSGNSLVISNGGYVFDTLGWIGASVTCSNNRVVVSGSGSVWSGDVWLGVGTGVGPGGYNSLVISNGGLVIRTTFSDGARSMLGFGTSCNSVLITGTGSVWVTAAGGNTYIGYFGGIANGVTVKNGGSVMDRSYTLNVGYKTGSDSNKILVSDPGSVWSTGGPGSLSIGYSGAANSLVISNGGLFVSGEFICFIGTTSTSSNNSVRVVDDGVWSNSTLYVGNQGSSNSLMVAGGSVFAANLVIGAASTTCDNFIELESGNIVVTNSSTNAVLEVRHGALIVNGGVLRVDRLVVTDSCARFIHTGGTLLVGSFEVDPNAFRIVSVAREGNDVRVTWMMGPGQTNTLQATSGDGNGGYSTNGFSDIFVVTNNASAGTVTNYLDVSAATNRPARYYRARLVP